MKHGMKQFSISTVGVSLWNSLGYNLKLSSSLSSFKINLRKVFIINMLNFNSIPEMLLPFLICFHKLLKAVL